MRKRSLRRQLGRGSVALVATIALIAAACGGTSRDLPVPSPTPGSTQTATAPTGTPYTTFANTTPAPTIGALPPVAPGSEGSASGQSGGTTGGGSGATSGGGSGTGGGSAAATATPVPPQVRIAGFSIPTLDVWASIETIGLIPNTNQLDVPKNPLNVGWYHIYDRPGGGGNALFSAHRDYWPSTRGPFFALADLQAGDEIRLQMDDGSELVYEVMTFQRYELATIPMGEIIWPSNRPQGEEWITLITCGGGFVSERPGGPGHYTDRDVVVARRIA